MISSVSAGDEVFGSMGNILEQLELMYENGVVIQQEKPEKYAETDWGSWIDAIGANLAAIINIPQFRGFSEDLAGINLHIYIYILSRRKRGRHSRRRPVDKNSGEDPSRSCISSYNEGKD